MRGADIWSLPAAQQFLTEIEQTIWQGGAVINGDASTPPCLAARVVTHLRDTVSIHRRVPRPDELPLEVLGELCGQAGVKMQAIVASGRFFLIEAQDLSPTDLNRWGHALADFIAHSAQIDEAGALLLIGDIKVSGVTQLNWNMRLRRADAMIWAEYAVPSGHSDIIHRLAVDLAVELCGWRLDLVADLVSQRLEDILDPMGWLQRNEDQLIAFPASFGPSPFACPLHLLAKGDLVQLRSRIWAAQMSVLFPWVEGHRQGIIQRYRKHLFIDAHLRSLGVFSVEDIELGALRYQLSHILSRQDADQLAALAELRNNLAHRKPIRPADFILASQIK
jgi:hypothetical protein